MVMGGCARHASVTLRISPGTGDYSLKPKSHGNDLRVTHMRDEDMSASPLVTVTVDDAQARSHGTVMKAAAAAPVAHLFPLARPSCLLAPLSRRSV